MEEDDDDVNGMEKTTIFSYEFCYAICNGMLQFLHNLDFQRRVKCHSPGFLKRATNE